MLNKVVKKHFSKERVFQVSCRFVDFVSSNSFVTGGNNVKPRKHCQQSLFGLNHISE